MEMVTSEATWLSFYTVKAASLTHVTAAEQLLFAAV
jgi:hypothetical protein